MKNFAELSGKEILALAIAQEEEDSRIYASFADGLKESYPATAGRRAIRPPPACSRRWPPRRTSIAAG